MSRNNATDKINKTDITERMKQAMSAVDFARSLYQDHIVENNILAVQKLSEVINREDIYQKIELILGFMAEEKNNLKSMHNQIRLDYYLKSLRDSLED